MRRVEAQLRDLMETAVGEPPHRVTVAAVRRRVIRRRVAEGVSGAAVVALLAWAGVAVAAIVPGPAPVSTALASPPRYYVQAPSLSQLVVRSTATGAVTARIASPWPGAHLIGPIAATAGDRTFYTAWFQGVVGNVTGSRIYRLQLTAAGRLDGYSLVRGGNLGKQQVVALAAAADGSRVAVALLPGTSGSPAVSPAVIDVIATATGQRTVWRNDQTAGGMTLQGVKDLVFTHDGRELGFDAAERCSKKSDACQRGLNEVRVITLGGDGGELASGQVVFRESELSGRESGYLMDALLTPDGSAVDVLSIYIPGNLAAPGASDYMSVVRVPAGGGQPALLYQLKTGHGYFFRSFSADTTGRFLLFNAGPTSGTRNGWINNGRLVPLTPANGSGVFDEAW